MQDAAEQLPDDPQAWDVDRIASLDWSYIRLCLAKASLMALQGPGKNHMERAKAFGTCIQNLLKCDDARREREDLEEFRGLVVKLEKIRDEIRESGGRLMPPPPTKH